ncbi:MAG: DegT/DnrJ/EryC1/StrS family aminotransferase [Betaproteobacteria bacterium]
MRSTFLNYSPPAISDEEREEVMDTLRSDWITTGPKTRRFEAEFATFIGAPAALALNSCTAGLHTALVALGVGPGDEVITTPMTFCATVNVIEHVGARPVLVDVEPDTLCISPTAVAEAVTPKTKCLLPVHYAGHPCDLDPLLSVAREKGLRVVEDAAHALPAKYKGRMIGTIGDLTAFSFYVTKNLTTAEGGMLTGQPELLERARVISLHGMSKDAWKRYDKGGSWYYEVVLPGFKYNMTDIQAAIGLQQLKKLPAFQERRRAIVQRYNEAFGGYPYFALPVERSEVEHAWHLYALRLNLETLRIGRDQFIEELKVRNIGTSVHFIPIHLHPYYRDKYGFKPNDFPVAYANYLRLISLPLNPRLTDQDVSDVIEAVVDVAEHFRR